MSRQSLHYNDLAKVGDQGCALLMTIELNLTRLIVNSVEQKSSRHALQCFWIEPEPIQSGKYAHLRRVGIESLLFASDFGHLYDLVGLINMLS